MPTSSPPPAPSTAGSTEPQQSSPSTTNSRKRQRSPTSSSSAVETVPKRTQRRLCPPFVEDYRPYGGLQLQRAYERRQQNHQAQWDAYYRHNTVNGYRDRQYLLREFPELAAAVAGEAPFTWLEAGCGVGNAMLPVFERHGTSPVWRALLGFDISPVAIRLLREKQAALPPPLAAKMHVIALDPCGADVASSELFAGRPKAELASMIFVLCSIPVEHHALVLRRVADCIADGGVFFFRDYAAGDHAAARFRARAVAPLGDSETTAGAAEGSETFTRTNGTLSHFFAVEEVRALFAGVGLEAVELEEIAREVTNRKQGVTLRRLFVQGRFRKGANSSSSKEKEAAADRL